MNYMVLQVDISSVIILGSIFVLAQALSERDVS